MLKMMFSYLLIGRPEFCSKLNTFKVQLCKASLCPLWVKSRHSRCKKPCPLYPRKRTLLAKRFNEFPKFDCFLRAGAVPVISVPFARGRTTASAMHPAHPKASYRGCTTRLPRPL